jgi:antitoxin CptB
MVTLAHRMARARFRAWHRGTREADFMIGGFFDKHHQAWSESDLAWFEALLDEDEVDVMAWALRAAEVPEKYTGPLMAALQQLDYVTI